MRENIHTSDYIDAEIEPISFANIVRPRNYIHKLLEDEIINHLAKFDVNDKIARLYPVTVYNSVKPLQAFTSLVTNYLARNKKEVLVNQPLLANAILESFIFTYLKDVTLNTVNVNYKDFLSKIFMFLNHEYDLPMALKENFKIIIAKPTEKFLDEFLQLFPKDFLSMLNSRSVYTLFLQELLIDNPFTLFNSSSLMLKIATIEKRS